MVGPGGRLSIVAILVAFSATSCRSLVVKHSVIRFDSENLDLIAARARFDAEQRAFVFRCEHVQKTVGSLAHVTNSLF